MSDLGLTHVALPVSNADNSIAFYTQYAHMQVVHHRIDLATKSNVVWLSDLTRPFVVVLIEVPQVTHPLLPIAHLGVACVSRAEVDRLCDLAKVAGILREGPRDEGGTVGYYAMLSDPDGHTLEISYGQEISFTLEHIPGDH
jgi:catechol 2,3-dioxygenase-like lactoylglutathione lyase family enzyme